MIHLHDLTRSYGGALALRGAELHLEPGERLALCGPSGSGKTTLLRLVAGLEIPDQGEVRLGGALASGPGVYLPPHARGLGMVLDRPALWPHLSAWRNVAFALPAPSSAAARDRALCLLAALELAPLADRLPGTLSSGQAQRVALARALAAAPSLLLLDEPFSNLDAQRTAQAVRLVAEEAERCGATLLLATHDLGAARALCPRVALLTDGLLRGPAPWGDREPSGFFGARNPEPGA